jgi:rubrerythrin
MSPFAVVFTVVVLLMGKTLAEIYLGGMYACPHCGTRHEDRHADECPWNR